MKPRRQTRNELRPALLLLLGGSATLAILLVWQLVSRTGPTSEVPVPRDGRTQALPAVGYEAATSVDPRTREPLAVRMPGPPNADEELLVPALDPTLAPGKAKEREFYADFLRQEASQPGVLQAQAAGLLARQGPSSEKVAFLRALCACASPAATAWLEQSVRGQPDVSTPQGESVASFALDLLARRCEADGESRSALGRLAFEAPGLSTQLRRRASARFAAVADEAQLARLAGILPREEDEIVVAGVLAALQSRPSTTGVRRILDAHTPPPTHEGTIDRPE